MSLVYEKMNLFNAPEGSLLVHACNAKGVWGSGIAKDFKEKFPTAFSLYNKFCHNGDTLGYGPVFQDRLYSIGCLITSSNFGSKVDTEDEILVHTTLALNSISSYKDKSIYSNKFNSGLFNVPWEKTEAILKVFVKRYNLNWTVCEK